MRWCWVMYTRLIWSTRHQGRLNAFVLNHVHKVNLGTRHQGRLNAFVLGHVHKVNVEHKAPGSAHCVGAKSCTQV